MVTVNLKKYARKLIDMPIYATFLKICHKTQKYAKYAIICQSHWGPNTAKHQDPRHILASTVQKKYMLGTKGVDSTYYTSKPLPIISS